jgi:hypothetical protein
MLLVVVGGFTIYKATSKDDAPSRHFAGLELAANDEDHSGTCYALSTLLIANGLFANAVHTWTAPDPDHENKWKLELERVEQGYNGPLRVFQNFTFEKSGEQVRLVSVEASDGIQTGLDWNIDQLIAAAHARGSTPVDRCLKDGGTGYKYPPGK